MASDPCTLVLFLTRSTLTSSSVTSSAVTGGSHTAPFLTIAALGFSALALTVFTALLVILRYRVAHIGAQMAQRQKMMANLAAELEAQALLARQMSVDLEELRKRVMSREETGQPAAPGWASGGLPLNLNRRGQILRLSKKGKSVAEIANDLNVAQGEVELLLKVCDLSQNTPGLSK